MILRCDRIASYRSRNGRMREAACTASTVRSLLVGQGQPCQPMWLMSPASLAHALPADLVAAPVQRHALPADCCASPQPIALRRPACRRSSVKGNSGLSSTGGTGMGPGVWPNGKNREARRAFRLVRVDRKRVTAPAGVRHMIRASAHRSSGPRIDNVEDQRRVHRNRRMQARRRLPGPIAHARHELALFAGWMQRHAPPVAGNHIPRIHQPARLHLNPLHR